MQFSVRTILIAVAFAGWVITTLHPGGMYVHLPVGVGIAAFVSFVISMRSVIANQNGPRKLMLVRLVMSLLVLLAFLIVYPAYWKYAVALRDVELNFQTRKSHVINHAAEIRDDGRTLLRRMRKHETPHVFATSDVVPTSMQQFAPSYMQDTGDCLLVMLGSDPAFSYLLIFPPEKSGRGTMRLAPGIWLCEPRNKRMISDSEWEKGIRN